MMQSSKIIASHFMAMAGHGWPWLAKLNNRNSSIHCDNQGARAKRARPFIVSVPAVVSAVLFDQNLDQKIDLGWPGSSPGLAQVKP